MKLKTILIVVALFAALSVVVSVVQRPSAAKGDDPRLGHSLAQGAPLDQATQIQLSDQGKEATLARQPDGTWRVTNYYDFPADFKKLSAFVNSLTEATIQQLVTSNPDQINRLEFKGAKIALLDRAGKELWSVDLGKSTDLGGRYVRFGNEPKAYLAGFTAWIDADAKNWADTQILNLKPEEVSSIEVPFGDSSLKISRAKKEDPWTSDKTPAGQQVSTNKLSNIFNSAGSLRFVETTAPGDANAAAAKAHERVFKFTTFAGKNYSIALGRKPEDKKPKPATPAAPAARPGFSASPASPEFETIPAGPVFVSVTSGDPAAPINAMMQKRAFQISDYAFTSLPQKPEDLFEPVPPPQPKAPAAPPAPPAGAPKKPTDEKAKASEPKKS